MSDPRDWLRELRHSWPLLRGRSRTEITTLPVPGTAQPPVRVGVDGAGYRHLLVPVGAEEVKVESIEGTLKVDLRTYTFSRVPLRYVDIACLRADLFDLFDEVLADVLENADLATDTRAEASLDVVERWRSLLGTHRSRLLTLVGQMSLFAELTILDLVTRDTALDISWWRGPRREPHDIVLPGCAVEVKAVGGSSSSVEIHGVTQLQPPGKPLALVLATVAEDDAGVRLPELIDSVLSRVDDRGSAIRLLTAAGYSTSDAERYREAFSVTELAHVVIDETVPRIVPGSFADGAPPAGVDGVNYRIELDALDALAARGETALLTWVRDQR
ncbi:MAG: PD-(D/E)XK motif protein [Pseudonocardia sp.]|uniref:PD-(D/E)XK motif protein n=1 Tax=Pseudonocardia sp. TaxID=60912 RepID=UPI001AC898FF|nr:PD-(D/E)XK motif protein [Pseudonocardia sp.]MBN9096709.1 PD-(D/E)XK motif protein [Pseudonocardia sp.]